MLLPQKNPLATKLFQTLSQSIEKSVILGNYVKTRALQFPEKGAPCMKTNIKTKFNLESLQKQKISSIETQGPHFFIFTLLVISWKVPYIVT